MMKTHTTIGADTMQAVHELYPKNAFIGMGISIARNHHERWDGTGYPEGLSGDRIPLESRIMSVADVYDAVRSKRCYKESISRDQSREIIQGGGGTQFDPVLVEAFMALENEFNRIGSEMGYE